MLGCKSTETFIESNVKLSLEGGKEVNREQYQRLIDKLIYLSHNCPDIAFAISVIVNLCIFLRKDTLWRSIKF